jgi:phosphoadenosine phosphosulfate reductase
MTSDGRKNTAHRASDAWPPGGADAQIELLAARHLKDGQLDLAGLLNDPDAGRIALVSSFGAESVVLLHMVRMAREDLPILFVDTIKHFADTYDYVELLTDRLDLKTVRFITPDPRLVAQEDPDGTLWERDPNMCCMLRKTFALQDALLDFDGWITGRKRFQGGARANLPFLERDGQHLKINPLVNYTPDMIEAYCTRHDLPRHRLLEHGYRSIGCAPCTAPVEAWQDARAGRWAGLDKVECGIHLGPDGSISRRRGN